MTPSMLIGLALAGAIGAPCRYLLDGIVQDRTSGIVPYGTLVVNVTGSLVLGLITGAVLYHGFPDEPKLWLGTGFCGSFTTFSTFAFETVRLVEERAIVAAIVNVGASVLLGTAAAAAGLAIAAAL